MHQNLRWWVYLSIGCLLTLSTQCAEDDVDNLIEKLLQVKWELVPDSPTYDTWRQPSAQYVEVFLFNWTNPEKFPAEKPHLEELGPYPFMKYIRYENITRNEKEQTLGYYIPWNWSYGNRSLDDKITTVDYVVALLSHLVRPMSYFIKAGNAAALRTLQRGISTTKTVRELLFDGYEDSLLSLKQYLPNVEKLQHPDKFGWFHKNFTLDTEGYMEITTGEGGTVPRQIVRWMHEDHNKYYKGSCSKLTGSTGYFFPRNLTEESELKVFLPDLCRSVSMPYVSSGVHEGIKYHKYGLGPSSFDKASPDANCFCDGPCEWDGVMNVSACHHNGPNFISLPHFLHGDPRLGEQFTGLKPDPEKHSFYYSVEPRTGLLVDAATRYQMNVYMEDDKSVFDSVPKLLFPVYWVQELRSSDPDKLDAWLP